MNAEKAWDAEVTGLSWGWYFPFLKYAWEFDLSYNAYVNMKTQAGSQAAPFIPNAMLE